MTGLFEPDEPLAGERTDLAWTRSGIAVALCVSVLLRRVWPLGRADHVFVIVLVAAGGLAWAVAFLVARRIARTTRQGRDVIDGRTLRILSAGTFVLALGAFVLGLLPPT